MSKSNEVMDLEAALSFEQLTTAHYAADLVAIVQLCGGDVEDGPSAARECVERALAERAARDARRLKLREGCKSQSAVDGEALWFLPTGPAVLALCLPTGVFTAIHADGSETDHATRLEAHDALIASGSESPFEVVTGPAVSV